MAITALFRIRSGEVLKISLKGQPFSDRNTIRFGVQTDPARPDGDNVRDLSGADPGPLRVLGFAKIWDSTNVRNATQVEIDTFSPDEVEDENEDDAEEAETLIDQGNPVTRKILKAVALVTMDEINILRALHALPLRTKVQLLNAVKSKVSKDD